MSIRGQFTPAGIAIVANIMGHLQAAEAEFNKLTATENHATFLFHGEGHSLNHCVRWGVSAAQEMQSELALSESEPSS
jgi:hypothetical protein